MPRRILAASAALLLAVLGGILVVGYANGADARAREGEELATVYVVGDDVPAGTPADQLGGYVREQQVPRRLLAPGAVTDLGEVTGQVATAALLPGDQLVTGRFADPDSLAPAGTVLAPDGMVEVSVSLEAQRALGGQLTPGDKVGVHITERPNGPGANVITYAVWGDVLHGVLVTRVSGDADDPAAPVTITLALEPVVAEAVVLGLEAQALWFSLEERATTTDRSSTHPSTTISLGDDS